MTESRTTHPDPLEAGHSYAPNASLVPGEEAPTLPMPTPTNFGKWLIAPATNFLFLRERESLCASILQGRRYEHVAQRAKKADIRPRRVLDFGAGEGAFSCWAYLTWPGCWIDAVEFDQSLRSLYEANAPPGAKLLDGGTIDANAYDVVRFACWTDAEKPLAALGQFVRVDPPILIVDAIEVLSVEDRRTLAEAKKKRAIARWQAHVDGRLMGSSEASSDAVGGHVES